MLSRDGSTCVYCGKAVAGSDATVDHVTPIALDPGRTYGDDELVTACRTCNGTKSDRATFRVNYTNPRWT